MPDKLRVLQELFLVEASKFQVFPLDNDILQRVLAPKPSYTAGRSVFTYSGELSGMASSDAPRTLARSYTISAEVEIPTDGGEGMIVTDGGRSGGYGLYLLKGKPVFLWNMVDLERIKWEGADALTPGRHTIEFDFKYEGIGVGTLVYNNFSGLAQPGTGTLKVDGKAVATKKMEKTLPMILQWDESFDIGSDTLTGVNDADYKPPFALTAKLNKLTIKVDRPQLSPADIKKLQAAMTEKAKRD
jgi:arylsulfatase